MDPNATVPQGDNTNLVPPPLEETPVVFPHVESATAPPPQPVTPPVPEQAPTPVVGNQPVDQPPTPPVTPPNPVPPEMGEKKSSPVFAIALTILLIAIIALAGYFVYTKYFSAAPTSTAVETAEPTIIPTEIPNASPSAMPSETPSASSPSASATPKVSPSSSPSGTPIAH